MDKKILKEILDRLNRLEQRVFSKSSSCLSLSPKTKTLPEIVKGKKFKNGQEKVAIIIGYDEKIEKKTDITESDVKKGWKNGKFDRKYNSNLLARAIKDGLVRNIDGNLDLSQAGEKFFDNF